MIIYVEEIPHLGVSGITASVKFVNASGEGQRGILKQQQQKNKIKR
jgi:hypothetical protein